MIDINVFDNIFDIAAISNYASDYVDGDMRALISYNEIDKQIKSLKAKGINPSLSMQIDFSQMLIENRCSSLKNYMILIHTFKDTIIGKIVDAMQSEKAKTKQKSSGK